MFPQDKSGTVGIVDLQSSLPGPDNVNKQDWPDIERTRVPIQTDWHSGILPWWIHSECRRSTTLYSALCSALCSALYSALCSILCSALCSALCATLCATLWGFVVHLCPVLAPGVLPRGFPFMWLVSNKESVRGRELDCIQRPLGRP